jgi:hypothetical protein
MYENEGAAATWLPDRLLTVGDVVSRTAGTGGLTIEARLKDLTGSEVADVLTRAGAPAVTLQRGATLQVAAAAKAALASTTVTFSKASSFVFSATKGTIAEYARLAPVRQALRDLEDSGVWNIDWQLVTAVRRFAACTLIIARDKGATAQIMATGPLGTQGLELIAGSTELAITKGDAATWTLKDATPLYEALVVSRSAWSGETTVDGRYLDRPKQQAEPSVSIVRVGAADLDA